MMAGLNEKTLDLPYLLSYIYSMSILLILTCSFLLLCIMCKLSFFQA